MSGAKQAGGRILSGRHLRYDERSHSRAGSRGWSCGREAQGCWGSLSLSSAEAWGLGAGTRLQWLWLGGGWTHRLSLQKKAQKGAAVPPTGSQTRGQTHPSP